MRNSRASHSDPEPIFSPSTDSSENLVSYAPTMIEAEAHFKRSLDEPQILDCSVYKRHSPFLTLSATGPCKNYEKN